MENVNLLVATKELEFPEYEIFKLDFKRSDKDYVLSIEVGQFCL